MRKLYVGWVTLALVAAGCLAVEARPSTAETLEGVVVAVSDGDTIRVLHDGQTTKVRFNGIDCPETDQAYGHEATEYTRARIFKKQVTVLVHGKDKYGRTIGEIIMPNGKSLERALVRDGYAWWYRKYAQDDRELEALEAQARTAKRGLWADPNSIPPWEFRQRKREKAQQG